MRTDHAADLDALRSIADQHHAGPGSALYVFAAAGAVPDPVQLGDEVAQRVAVIEEQPSAWDDLDTELDRLYELATWVDSHRVHYHVGHNTAGYLPETDPECLADPDEAVEAFVAMVQEVATDDDDIALEQLNSSTWDEDDYQCNCGHACADHGGDGEGPCDQAPCSCGGFAPDWGDSTPMMRAEVDAVLADRPPQPGQDYEMSILDAESWRHEFFIHVLVIDGDDTRCATGAVQP